MIKKLIENLKDSFKEYLTNHLGTNIVLIILSLVIIMIDLDDPSEFIQRLIITLFLTGMFTVLGESYTKDNKKRYIIYIIGLIISIITSKCILDDDLARYLVGVVLAVESSIIYLMAKNSKEKTNNYLVNIATNLLKLGIVGIILNIGLMLILGLISTLLIELDYIVFTKLEILLLVLYYIPALIISLETKPEEESKFIYAVINYVSLPLVSIATIIIYLYLVKLLVTQRLPHTATFGTNAILLTLGIPIVLMSLSYDENKLPYKIANKLKHLFIPLVLLQIFALSIRIHDYSITPSRYFGIILIILGIISLLLLNRDNGSNYKLILLPCIILSITSFIIPYINIYDLPNYMQINRLKKILPEGRDFNKLTTDETENIRSIYYQVYDDKYYPDYLSRDKLEKILFDYNDYKYTKTNYIYYNKTIKNLDISEYNKIDYYSSHNNKKLTITVNKEEYDLTEFCKELDTYDKENDNIDNYLQEKQPLELDSNTYLYITDLSLEYNTKELSLKGYILYK
ncbi:MAG: DUF4153 domain-containing protein [Bacilli bacterium]|nr:DUF4153 domain-containing protein [Bacilli bacterium]